MHVARRWIERALWSSLAVVAGLWLYLFLVDVEVPPPARYAVSSPSVGELQVRDASGIPYVPFVETNKRQLFFVMDAECPFTKRNYHNWRVLIEAGDTGVGTAVLSVSDVASTRRALEQADIDVPVYWVSREQLEALGYWGFPMTVGVDPGKVEQVSWTGYLSPADVDSVGDWIREVPLRRAHDVLAGADNMGTSRETSSD